MLHKARLCSASEFFEKAFDGGFKEATEGKMTMEDVDPEIFGYLVDPFYQKSFKVAENVKEKVDRYVDVYLLAD